MECQKENKSIKKKTLDASSLLNLCESDYKKTAKYCYWAGAQAIALFLHSVEWELTRGGGVWPGLRKEDANHILL